MTARSVRRRGARSALLAVLSLLATLLVASASASAAVPQPQQDPFYQPPAGFAAAAPGAILRSRPVQLAAFSQLPQRVQAWQVMYRSTDYQEQPMVAVTTLLKPAGVTPKAVISYQVAEDASAPQCAPSYVLRRSAAAGEVVNQAEILLIDAAVAQGYAVSVPDYEGLRGDFGAPRQPGYAILDGLRASEDFAPLGIATGRNTPVAAWGYSGGSLATGWAAQMQTGYAPDLDVRGMAVGGFVTDLAGVLLKINGGFGSGLIASALPGVARTSAGLSAALDHYLNDRGRAVVADASTHCEIHNVSSYAFQDTSRYLTVPLKTFLALPAVRDALAEDSLSGPTPTVPLYVYQAVHDELVPVAGADRTVPRYCAGGGSVRYERDLLSEHGSLAVTGASAALAWLSDQLGSSVRQTGCSTRTVLSTALTPGGLRQLPGTVRAILISLLDLPIGPLVF